MDENLNATRPLLLKHRLTLSLSLWCLTAESPHYIHSSCIYWQEKCGATTPYTTLHCFPLFLSIAIALTTHLFKLNSIQINLESSWSWNDLILSLPMSLYPSLSLRCNSGVIDEGYLPSGLDFITVVWSDLGRCLPLVSGWAAMFVSYVCVSINALILLTVLLAQIERAWLTD